MKLTGNILAIRQKREDKNQQITLALHTVTYVTYKKDGKYHQPFEYEDEIEVPVILTGDCLARTDNRHLEEGAFEFHVFDKVGDTYVLNDDKFLSITTVYDDESQEVILSSAYYSVVLTNEAFKQLKTDRSKALKEKRKKRK